MARRTLAVLPHLRRALAGAAAAPGDAQLLEGFLARPDGEAFAALVRRHGPMVLAVCRRILRDPHDAEDAFQATFLVLLRKARSVARPEHLANWLYGVACRTALKARGNLSRRRLREQPLLDVPNEKGVAELVWLDVRPIIDEELSRLPDKLRLPVVLCCLEGRSRREAARLLGWPEGTLSTRLHEARQVLRRRLPRRGLALSAAAVVAALSQGAAPAAVPAALAASIVKGTNTANAAALALGVLRTMWLSKVNVVGALALLTTLTATGVVGVALCNPATAQEPAEQKAPPGRPAEPKKAEPAEKELKLDAGTAQIAWSPDGKQMASLSFRREKRKGGGEDDLDFYSTVKVWDAETGKEKASLGEVKNTGAVMIAFSPDGATLALSYRRQIEVGDKIELWDANKAALKMTIELDYGRVAPKVVFAPDGKTLAVLYAGDTDRDRKVEGLQGGVRLWDVGTGKALRSLRGHKHLAISAAFSPDGKLLATGGDQHDKTVRLWDVAAGTPVRSFDLGDAAPALAFSPDGKALASGLGDGHVVLWDPATGKEVKSLKSAFDGTYGLSFSPDGRLLAAAGKVTKEKGYAREARAWDVATGEVRKSWEEGSTAVVSLWEWKDQPAARDPDKPAGADERFARLKEQLAKAKKTDEQAVEAVYLATVGRFPSDAERKTALDHLAKKKDQGADALEDLIFALTNSKEYLTRLDALNRQDPRQRK